MNWKNNKLEKAIIRSTVGGECMIRPHEEVEITRNHHNLHVDGQNKGIITVNTRAGDVLVLTAGK